MEDYELDALKRITTRPPLKYRTLDVTPSPPSSAQRSRAST